MEYIKLFEEYYDEATEAKMTKVLGKISKLAKAAGMKEVDNIEEWLRENGFGDDLQFIEEYPVVAVYTNEHRSWDNVSWVKITMDGSHPVIDWQISSNGSDDGDSAIKKWTNKKAWNVFQ